MSNGALTTTRAVCSTTVQPDALDEKSANARPSSAGEWSMAPAGPPEEDCHERHDASDLETQNDRTRSTRAGEPHAFVTKADDADLTPVVCAARADEVIEWSGASGASSSAAWPVALRLDR